MIGPTHLETLTYFYILLSERNATFRYFSRTEHFRLLQEVKRGSGSKIGEMRFVKGFAKLYSCSLYLYTGKVRHPDCH